MGTYLSNLSVEVGFQDFDAFVELFGSLFHEFRLDVLDVALRHNIRWFEAAHFSPAFNAEDGVGICQVNIDAASFIDDAC